MTKEQVLTQAKALLAQTFPPDQHDAIALEVITGMGYTKVSDMPADDYPTLLQKVTARCQGGALS